MPSPTVPQSGSEAERPRVRAWVAGAVVVLVLALGGFSIWQTWSGAGHVERMMRARSVALHAAAAREIQNVVRYGTSRRERLDAVLLAIAAGPDVVGVRLERPDGGAVLAHGRGVLQSASKPLADGLLLAGDLLIVAGPLRLETRGCHDAVAEQAERGGCGCGVQCPAAGDDSLDGDYRLVTALAAAPYFEIAASLRWQGLAGGALWLGLCVALLLFARQARRQSDMRAALAFADARSRFLERLSVVAAGLAHEIKNPLGSLRGFAQLLGEALPQKSREAEYATLMVTELDAINRRIDGLRHFARPSLPKLSPCAPAAVVRRVVLLLEPDLHGRELTLDLALPPAPDELTLGDEERLRELVVNLVMNAIEASPQHGKVRVALTFERAAGGGHAGRFVLEVEDQGPGIPPETREAALRPFFSTKPGGLGLGLALAQRAVEDHGGTLEIKTGSVGGALLCAAFPRRAP
jgi:signal transduction histidine kinase